MRCPTCAKDLASHDHDGVVAWSCDACRGTALSHASLATRVSKVRANVIREQILGSTDVGARPCPGCGAAMSRFLAGPRGKAVVLDACSACSWIWFDATELEALGVVLSPSPSIVPPAVKAAAPAAKLGLEGLGIVVDVLELITSIFP